MGQKIDDLRKLRDPKFYLETFCKIKNKDGGLIPFILNDPQKDLFNLLNAGTRKIICLKARQLGYSTAIAGYFYHYTIMNPGITAGLIGYNSGLVTELLDKIKTFIRTTPKEFRPTIQYNSKYEISFPKMDSKIMILPSSENVGSGYTLNLCLSGETKILIEHGRTSLMKDIKAGDIIINGKGGRSKVKEVIKRKTDKRMVSINAYGMQDVLTATEDHLVLSRNNKTKQPEWKEAGMFVKGDYVAYPNFQVRNNRYKVLKIDSTVRRNHINENLKKDIELNYDFGLLMGWYLAEGTVTDYETAFSLDSDEVDEFLKLANKFSEYISNIRVDSNGKSRTRIVRMYGADFARFIEKYFGRTEEKRIDDCVFYWGTKFVDGLLFGIFSGDGCFTKDDKIILTNTNEGIINQVRKLLVARRIGFSNIYKKKSYRYGVPCKDRYDLMVNGGGNYKFRRWFNLTLPIYQGKWAEYRREKMPYMNQGHHLWRRGKFYYWAKVKEVKEADGEEYVYDIVLEKEPHSFLTTAGVVHNCLITELAKWDKAEEKMTSLSPAITNGIVIVESTPTQSGSYFHRMVTQAELGDSQYTLKKYQWWWGYKKEFIDQEVKEKGERYVSQEYRCMFSTSGRSVFDAQLIRELNKNVLEVGDMNDNYKVSEYDGLRTYREPVQDEQYIVAADVSEGVDGGDYAVASVWSRKTGEEVAMYRGLLPPDRFGDKLNELGRNYNNALMVVESNNHGLTTLTRLKELLYPTMYFRQQNFETVATPFSDKLGWRTNKATRPLMIDELNKALRTGALTPRSKELINEMLVFVYDDNGNMDHQPGFHDDCIFSAAMAWQGWKVMFSGIPQQIDHHNYFPTSYSY